MHETVMIGDLSRSANCKVETIRYYERIGLMPEPGRSEGGYRLYTVDHGKRLKFIRRSRELGFGIDQIKDLLTIFDDNRNHTRAEVKAITETHIADVQAKIKSLKRLETSLRELTQSCDGDDHGADTCPILQTLSDDGC